MSKDAYGRTSTEVGETSRTTLDPKTQAQADAFLLESLKAQDRQAADQALRNGANVNAVEAQTGATALMLAAGSAMFDTVKKLIEGGADVNAKDKLERTAIEYGLRREETFAEIDGDARFGEAWLIAKSPKFDPNTVIIETGLGAKPVATYAEMIGEHDLAETIKSKSHAEPAASPSSGKPTPMKLGRG